MPLEIEKIYFSRDLRKARNLEIEDDNTDVIVKMTNGELYAASFFSYASILLLQKKHKETGAFWKGRFFWARNMILVSSCQKKIIQRVINLLLTEEDFLFVFRKLD